MKYIYFCKNDPNEEAIGVIHAESQTEAEYIGSVLKKLSVEDFLKLFKVKIYE